MKRTILLLAMALGLSSGASRAAEPVNPALQKGLLEEEANQNLGAAIREYQAVLDGYAEQRKVAATALFRMGECYRKLGQTSQAQAQFQRVLQDFPEQTPLVTLSRKNLAKTVTAEGTGAGTPIDSEQVKLLRDEIALVQQQLREAQKKAEAGLATSEEVLAAQRQLLPLERKLPENSSAEKQQASINQEIQLVQQLLDIKERRYQNGQGTSAELFPLKRDLLSLRRDLLAAQAPPMATFQTRLQSIVRAARPSNAASDEEEREIARLRDILQNSPDLINARTAQSGVSPLQDAAAKGQLAVAQFLLDNHADLEVGNGAAGGGAALNCAALNGHKTMVELLLDRGAKVDSRDGSGATPLFNAASRGFQQIAEVLLAKGADVNAKNNDGATPLHVAGSNHHLSMVKLLIEHKADVNAQDKHGDTPLQLAVLREQEQNSTPAVDFPAEQGTARLPVRSDSPLVKLLLDSGAEPNLRDHAGRLPLSLALELGKPGIAELLLDHGANPDALVQFTDSNNRALIVAGEVTPLVFATANNNLSLARLLVSHGAKVNQPDANGRTPLHWAAIQARPRFVEFLLSQGADPNLKDQEGKTALQEDLQSTTGRGAQGLRPQHVPFAPDRRQILDALLEKGAQVNTTDTNGITPLIRAVQSVVDTNIVALLLARGADINQPGGETTPLLFAVDARNLEMAGLLLAKGAAPNRKGGNGETPLHVAAAHDDSAMAELLLKAGADPNAQDLAGNTPIYYAAYVGNKEIVQMLLKGGARLDVTNKEGVGPADVSKVFYAFMTGAYGVPIFRRGHASATDRQAQTQELLIRAAHEQKSE